jgi:hypothetical protein
VAQIVESLVTEIRGDDTNLQATVRRSEQATQRLSGSTSALSASTRTLGQAFGTVSQRLQNVVGDIANTGDVTRGQASRLINVAGDIAFAFGPQGALVGAIGITGLFLTRFFAEKAREAEEFGRRVQETLRSIRREGLDAAQQRQRDLALGDSSLTPDFIATRPEKEQRELEARRRGVRGLVEEIERLNAAARSSSRVILETAQGPIRAFSDGSQEAKERIAELRSLLRLIEPEYAAVTQRVNELARAKDRSNQNDKFYKELAEREKDATREAKKQYDERLKDANDALDKLRKQGRDASRAVRDALTEGITDGARRLREQVENLRRDLAGKGFDDAQIEIMVQAFLRLEGASTKAAASIRKVADAETPKALRDAADAMRRELDALDQAGQNVLTVLDVADGIASAFGGATDEIGRLLDGIKDAVRGVIQLATEAAKVGRFGALLNSSQGIGALLGGVGAIVSGVASLASLLGSSPQDEARRRALEQNTAALKQVERGLLTLANTSASGGLVADVRDLLNSVPLGVPDPLGFDRDFGLDLLRRAAEKAGIAFEDIEKIAEELGFSLEGGDDALRKFRDALNEIDLTNFQLTFGGGREEIDLDQFLNEGDTLSGLQKLIELLTDPTRGAPALFGDLANVDLSTKEGRDLAKAIIRQIFADFKAGNITADDLGGLSVDEFTDALKDLFGGITDLDEELIAKAKQAQQEAEDAIKQQQEAADAEARAAEEARAARVREARERAAQLAALNDLDTGAALETLLGELAPLSPALADLAGQFDLTTEEGVKGFKAALVSLFQSIVDGTFPLETLGDLTLPELIDILLQFDGSLDALADSLGVAASEAEQAAQRLRDAFDDLDFETALFGITDPIVKAGKTLAAAAEAFPEIGEALAGFDLNTDAGRAGAIAALQQLGLSSEDEAFRSAILRVLNSIRDIPGAVEDAVGGAVAERVDPLQGTAVQSGVAQLTERTGSALLDVQRAAYRRLGDIVSLLSSMGGVIAPPAIPAELSLAGGGGGLSIGDLSLTVNVPTTATDGAEIAAATEQGVEQALNRALGTRLTQWRRFKGGLA